MPEAADTKSATLRRLPGVEAELFEPPSREAQFLLRHAAWLVSPRELPGPVLGQMLRVFLVAPFTQLTFYSFELQAFLFGVFHTTFVARAGHLAFMAGVNFMMLVALGRVQLGGGLDAGHVYAIVVGLWHLSIALSVGLVLWGVCSVAVMGGLAFAARACLSADSGVLAALSDHAWLGVCASAFLIALSHTPEPLLPPRAVAGPRWLSIAQYVRGPSGERGALTMRLARGLRVALFVLWGTLNEWWAAMRLLPYNVLWLLFAAGYAKPVRDRVLGHVRRALDSGNPALDYVGVGGATMLERVSASERGVRDGQEDTVQAE